MFLRDSAQIHWEIQRLQRCKVEIINPELRPALEHLLKQTTTEHDDLWKDVGDGPKDVSMLYFCNDAVKAAVRKRSGSISAE